MPQLFSLYSYNSNYIFNKIVTAMKNEVAALQNNDILADKCTQNQVKSL